MIFQELNLYNLSNINLKMRPVRGPHKKSVTSSHNINLVLSLNDQEKRS